MVPTNMQQVTYQENLSKVVVKMTNGDLIVIDDSLKVFGKKYHEATNATVTFEEIESMRGFWLGLLTGAAGTCIGYLLSYVFTRAL